MHPICLDFLTAIELSPPELVALAAENRCDAVSFMVHPVQGVPDFAMDGDSAMRRETKIRCQEVGVAIDMLEGFLLTPEVDVALFRPSLESAKWLGATRINALLRDDDLARLADRFAALAEEAAGFGLETLTEWSIRTPLKTPAEAAAFVAGIGRPTARLQFDSLHLYRGGFSAADIAGIDPRLIARAQISDGPSQMPLDKQYAEAIGDRLPPGEGALPLHSFVNALPAGITIGVEVPMPKEAGVPAARVRRAVEGARRLVS